MASINRKFSTEDVLQTILLDSGSESESDSDLDWNFDGNDSDVDAAESDRCDLDFLTSFPASYSVHDQQNDAGNRSIEADGWINYDFYDDYSPDWLPEFIPYNQRRQHGVLVDEKPIDFFHKFFPLSVFELIAEETNRYADLYLTGRQLPEFSRFRRWNPTTPDEICAYTALQISMGLCNKFSLNDYWCKYWLTYTPFAKVMSRDRYMLLSAFFHLSDSTTYIPRGQQGYDPLHKVRRLLDIVDPLYLFHYLPSKCLSIDESMVGFKGRIHFRQYMPAKPTKWGLKQFVLCDSRSGYQIKSIIYTGKDSFVRAKDVPLTEDVVLKLLDGFERKGHIVYMDNFYSSPKLFQTLQTLGIGACGTVNMNRQGMPKDFKTAVLRKGDDPLFKRQRDLVACLWHDTKKVTLLSTVHTDNTVDKKIRSRNTDGGFRMVDKPVIAESYNHNMSGVDLMDQLVGSYEFPHKSSKWYHPIYHRVREVALTNGYLKYKEYCERKGLRPVNKVQFRRSVIDGLLEGFEGSSRKALAENTNPARLTERHFIKSFENKKHKPDCIVCSDRSIKRKQTSYFCKQCELPMCLERCFERYHTMKQYR